MKRAIGLILIVALHLPAIPPTLAHSQKKTSTNAPRKNAPTPTASTSLSEQATNQAKFALLVGIKDYLYWQPLDAPHQDVADMKALLVSNKFQFPDDARHLQSLTGKVTHDDIIKAFRNHLIANARQYKDQNPLIIFYYSGHGSQKKDDNHDEADGLDETIVPYDSAHNHQQGNGKNTDVTDDELNALIAELSVYTQNILMIFDSCHSGSISRGAAKSRLVTPDLRATMQKSDEQTGDHKDYPLSDLVNQHLDCVTLTACLSGQSAYEREWPKKAKKPNGVFTYYLIEALKKATPATSYKALLEEVAMRVRNEQGGQDPQSEGRTRSAVFAGAVQGEDPFIPITRVEGNRLTIKAGSAFGIKAGTQIGIYAADAVTLKGEAGAKKFIINAEVKSVAAFTAIAEMPESKGNAKASAVTTTSKAAILNAYLLDEPLRVDLQFGNRHAPANAEHTETDFSSSLGETLKERGLLENNLIRLVAAPPKTSTQTAAPADLLLLRRHFNEQDFPAPEGFDKTEAVYYLAESGNGQPLYGLLVRAGDRENAAKLLADAVESYAKQKNLRALMNQESPLNEAVKMSVIPIVGEVVKNAEGRALFKVTGELAELDEEALRGSAALANPFLPFDYHFRLKLVNQSDEQLFVTLVNISTDGGIRVIYASPKDEPLDPRRAIKTGVYATSEPSGVEIFKVIVTREYQDFSALEAEGITRTRGAVSPLTRLLNQSALRRRDEPVPEFSQYHWGTTQLQMLVGLSGQKK